MLSLEKKNLKNFIDKGFPNKRIEDWKFSDLNHIISSNIENLSFYDDKTYEPKDQVSLINKFEHNKIIFINGAISKVEHQVRG